MKRFIITMVTLQAMMIGACNMSAASGAQAIRNNRHHDVRVERVVRGSDHRINDRYVRHHSRPAMGMRVAVRPLGGKYCYVKGERLWLADGILYRIAYTNRGTFYTVVGYL